MNLASLLGGNIGVLLFFIVPGFISMKVYDLLVPRKRRDFSKGLLEMLVFGSINFALLFWPFAATLNQDFASNHPICQYLILLLLLLLAPIAWPSVYLWLIRRPWIAGRIVPPSEGPWDDVFRESQERQEGFWVIVHMRDGRMFGGKYGAASFASEYPAKKQIYLEELWELNDDGSFGKKIPDSRGALFLEDSFEVIEFFALKGDANG